MSQYALEVTVGVQRVRLPSRWETMTEAVLVGLIAETYGCMIAPEAVCVEEPLRFDDCSPLSPKDVRDLFQTVQS